MLEVFARHLAEQGIKHVPDPPHSPELNGVEELTNGAINNLVRCAPLSASLTNSFWADALENSLLSLHSVLCNTP